MLTLPCYSSRVFLLGPSHHFYSKRCHLSAAEVYDTPLGETMTDSVCVPLDGSQLPFNRPIVRIPRPPGD